MNEHERPSQLSALFDGELPVEQAGMVIRRAMKDGQMRASWGRYALIGAAIRNEPLAVRTRLGDDVAARVAARLSAEMSITPASVQPAAELPQQRAARSQFAKGAWGMAVAASVAVVSLVVLQLWLFTATMNAYLGGDDLVVWPAAIASGVEREPGEITTCSTPVSARLAKNCPTQA